jgi:hypothetical protein
LKKNNKPEQKPFNPYSIDKLHNIKPGIKVGFLKFWVSGAAFFLTFTAFAYAVEDLLIAMFLLMTLGVEYIVNKVIMWMDNDKFPTLLYLPHHVERKSILSLLATAGYVLIMITGSYFAIEGLLSVGIPSIGMLLFGFDNIGIDPITFGLVYWLMDFIWLQVKNRVYPKYMKKEEKNV